MVFTNEEPVMNYMPQPAFLKQDLQQPQQQGQYNAPEQQFQVTSTEQKSFVNYEPTHSPTPAVPVTITENTTYLQTPPCTVQVVTLDTQPVNHPYKPLCILGIIAAVISYIGWFLGIGILIALILAIVAQICLWINFARNVKSGNLEAVKFAKVSIAVALVHISLLVVLICLQVVFGVVLGIACAVLIPILVQGAFAGAVACVACQQIASP